MGLLFGRLRKTKLVLNPIKYLFKRQTSDNYYVNLWEESISNKEIVLLKIQLKEDSLIYLGQLYRVTSPYENTHLELKYYQCKDSEGNLIRDYSNDDSKSYIVDSNSIKTMATQRKKQKEKE